MQRSRGSPHASSRVSRRCILVRQHTLRLLRAVPYGSFAAVLPSLSSCSASPPAFSSAAGPTLRTFRRSFLFVVRLVLLPSWCWFLRVCLYVSFALVVFLLLFIRHHLPAPSPICPLRLLVLVPMCLHTLRVAVLRAYPQTPPHPPSSRPPPYPRLVRVHLCVVFLRLSLLCSYPPSLSAVSSLPPPFPPPPPLSFRPRATEDMRARRKSAQEAPADDQWTPDT